MKQFLVSGGYPEIVVKNLDVEEYLSVLFDSLLFKDVVKRHKVRFAEQIENLSSYLINNVASTYSLRRLTKALDFRSGVTLEKYLSYLIEAYMLFSLQLYSHKSIERLKSPRKAYVVDNGFISAKAVQYSPDVGKLLENLVFIELVKKGFEPNRDLFYYKTRNDREVDFVLRKNKAITELVQVVYELNNPETEQREIKALIEASQELKVKNLTVITWNEKKVVEKNGLTINFVPVWERFLE